MTVHDYECLVPSYDRLPEEVRVALDAYLVGARVLEITTGRAHGVIETGVTYLCGDELHQVVYDETTHKILGGSEPAVVDAVLATLDESARAAVRAGGETIRKLKIKHDDRDDREYLHVHYADAAGELSGAKLELDGSPKGRTAKADQSAQLADDAVQAAINAALAALPEADRQVVRAGGDRVCQIKIKRQPHKERSRITVHYFDAEDSRSKARYERDDAHSAAGA